jgi:hypothetical protein
MHAAYHAAVLYPPPFFLFHSDLPAAPGVTPSSRISRLQTSNGDISKNCHHYDPSAEASAQIVNRINHSTSCLWNQVDIVKDTLSNAKEVPLCSTA